MGQLNMPEERDGLVNDVEDELIARLEREADEEEQALSRIPVTVPKTLSGAAMALEMAKAEKDVLERKLKSLNEEIKKLEIEVIPDLMNKAGIVHNGKGNFTTATGGKIALRNEVHVGVKKEDEAQLFTWLRENGDGDIIKETVHPSTLKAHVKELLSEGVKIPAFIGTYTETKAVLTRGRKES